MTGLPSGWNRCISICPSLWTETSPPAPWTSHSLSLSAGGSLAWITTPRSSRVCLGSYLDGAGQGPRPRAQEGSSGQQREGARPSVVTWQQRSRRTAITRQVLSQEHRHRVLSGNLLHSRLRQTSRGAWSPRDEMELAPAPSWQLLDDCRRQANPHGSGGPAPRTSGSWPSIRRRFTRVSPTATTPTATAATATAARPRPQLSMATAPTSTAQP